MGHPGRLWGFKRNAGVPLRQAQGQNDNSFSTITVLNVAAEELVEEVDVDLAELLLEGWHVR
jgi:hypothetical protein